MEIISNSINYNRDTFIDNFVTPPLYMRTVHAFSSNTRKMVYIDNIISFLLKTLSSFPGEVLSFDGEAAVLENDQWRRWRCGGSVRTETQPDVAVWITGKGDLDSRRSNAGLIIGQRRRRWLIIKPALGPVIVGASLMRGGGVLL